MSGQGPRGERGPRQMEDEQWIPSTKLGRLVEKGRVHDLCEIFRYSVPIREPEIIEQLIPAASEENGIGLVEEVCNVVSVQKQTTAGQRTRFRAHAIVGNRDGFVGYGAGVSKEVANAIKKAIRSAKLNIVPVRLGFWGGKLGDPHTVSSKLSGKCGSVRIRLIPAPRGAGIVASPTVAKVLEFAGVADVFTSQSGHTRTLMNSVGAVYNALKSSYSIMTPDLWHADDLDPLNDVRAMQVDS